MKKNQKGFSAVEALIILGIVGLVAGVGWYVWQARNNDTEQTTNSNSSTTSDETTSSTYEDDYVSFTYPSSWKAENQQTFTDDFNAHLINLTAPVDSDLKAADSAQGPLHFQAYILIAKNDQFGAGGKICNADCTVYQIDKVSPKSPSSDGSLVVSDWGTTGHPQVAEYTRTNVAIGDKTYALGLAVNDSYYARIYGFYMSADSSYIRLVSDTDFQNSEAYKQLKELVPTITFKTDKL